MDTNILGKQVLPLVMRNRISGYEADRTNGSMGEWLSGDERRNHYRRAVLKSEKEIKEENKNQKWYIFSICADDTYDLKSEFGFARIGLSRNEFRIIKNGENWL